MRTQAITIEVVLDDDGQPLRPNRSSPVLLLGDSFTNIYSAPQMGWGPHGLPEHLAYHLGKRVELIARNDAGAYATREMLKSDHRAAEVLQGEASSSGSSPSGSCRWATGNCCHKCVISALPETVVIPAQVQP